MANLVSNVAKGRVAELHERVNNNDPSTSGLIVIPLETSGLVSDATLIDYATVALMLAGATNEQTTMGRKTLTDADLAAITTDNTNDRNDCSVPDITWASGLMSGNAVSKFCIAYFPDVSGADSTGIPLVYFDRSVTPDGNAFTLTGGVYFRAS